MSIEDQAVNKSGVNNKKTINAWVMYDWANSVYSLTITTAVFPSYFLAVTGGKGGYLDFFGLQFKNSELYTYALSLAFLIVAIQNPFLSAIADTKGSKKRFMQFFSYLGSISCGLMYFFTSDNIGYGLILSILAAIGYAGSLVFYNAYLPEIASEDQYDKISAKGFALGYIGSVILLIFNLVLILNAEVIGISTGMASRISFLTVGIWWFVFAQYTFANLQDKPKKTSDESVFKRGIRELGNVWRQTSQLPLLRKYLIAFFFYSMGVQTVMYLATIFGEEVVGLQQAELIGLVLVLQLLAIVGAYGMTAVAKRKGNIFALSVTMVLWSIVCICAFFMKEGMVTAYYLLGVLVGIVMGGVQSMSRSTYSKLIPQETKDTASYFSFYETLEKSSIALGTFVYGGVLHLTGSMNYSALAMVVFFIVGLVVLAQIPSKTSYKTSLRKS